MPTLVPDPAVNTARKQAFAAHIASFLQHELGLPPASLTRLDDALMERAIGAFEALPSGGYQVILAEPGEVQEIEKCLQTHATLAEELPRQLPAHMVDNGAGTAVKHDPISMVGAIVAERDQLSCQVEADQLYRDVHAELVSTLREYVGLLEKSGMATPGLSSAKALLARAEEVRLEAAAARLPSRTLVVMLDRVVTAYEATLVRYGRAMTQEDVRRGVTVVAEAACMLQQIQGAPPEQNDHEEDQHDAVP